MTTTNHILVCPGCRALNRVQTGREAQATCPKCKTPVFKSAPIELIGSTFDRHITKSEIPVLVDFYSPTCGPCLMMGPQFDEAARQLHPAMRLAKIDTSMETAIAQRYSIQAVPTLAIFKEGKLLASQPGAMNAPDIVRWAQQYI